jgi:hypothetical protein
LTGWAQAGKYFVLLVVWFKYSATFTGNSVAEKVQADQQDTLTPKRYQEALEYFLPFPHSTCFHFEETFFQLDEERPHAGNATHFMPLFSISPKRQ